MFFTTYKNSLKTLLRSKTLLLSVLLVIFVAIYEAHGVHYGTYSFEVGGMIMEIGDYRRIHPDIPPPDPDMFS